MDDGPPSLLDPRVVRGLLRQLSRTDVEELEIVRGDARIYVRREPGPRSGSIALTAAETDRPADAVLAGVPVAAPLAGIFYPRPSPEAPPYVQPGDLIEAGVVIGLIETMKMYNEVTTDVGGEVVSIAVEEGDLVAAGQPLLYVRAVEEGSR